MKFKSKKAEILFGIVMSLFMVIGMEIYNLSLHFGHVENWMFIDIWHLNQVPMIACIVFVIENFFAGPIARKNCFKLVDTKKDNPLFITLVMAGCTVLIMCPIMSMFATIFFKFNGINNLLSTYIETVAMNFPMALIWQVFFVGPLTRKIFKKWTIS